MAKSKISKYVDLAGESVSNVAEIAKERIGQKPLHVELDRIILFKENNYQYIRIIAKGYYFGRVLNENDSLDARCFVVGRLNPVSGEVDYSYGTAKSPESMGYVGFDYDKKTGFWTVDFGPWPEEFPLQGQDIIVRLNAKGHSTATRGKVE
jgi:hypothetical protein